MAQTHTGGNIYMDPGVLGLAEEYDFDCEENSLDHVHAFCTGLGEWCPHMKVYDAYSFTINEKRIAPTREWCPIWPPTQTATPPSTPSTS